MHILAVVRTGLLETPVPTPTVNPDDVTPGPYGFLVVAILAVVVVLLVIDMLRRVRRVKYRAEVQEMLDAEEAAAAERPVETTEGGDQPENGPTDPR